MPLQSSGMSPLSLLHPNKQTLIAAAGRSVRHSRVYYFLFSSSLAAGALIWPLVTKAAIHPESLSQALVTKPHFLRGCATDHAVQDRTRLWAVSKNSGTLPQSHPWPLPTTMG